MPDKQKQSTTKSFPRTLAALAAALIIPLTQGCHPPGPHSQPGINHLKGECSPYLLEHAADPVHWYPWCDDAFAQARKENKPVFLSSGFAACHWCHVMHQESFLDPETAKILNDNFVSIKVDREELPYVDEVYTRAALALSGHAGWPLTAFLTPDKKPFFAGTYFPTADRDGLPSFKHVLEKVLETWHNKRGEVDKTANELCLAIYNFDVGKADKAAGKSTVSTACDSLLTHVDTDFGGLAGERKFALPGDLTLAMQQIALDPGDKSPATAGLRRYLYTTLNRMAAGGIHDQLNGGFFRYSTDRQWLVPHFEKMLSDNALLAQIYLQASLLTPNKKWRAVGLNTLDFCLKEFGTAEGTFLGSSDADNGGQEGAYYTFTDKEINLALGAQDGRLLCTIYGVAARGQAADGRCVLHLTESEEKLARDAGLSENDFRQKLSGLKAKLLNSKLMKERAAPIVDKKVITSWNALMISALLEGYKVSGDEKYLTAARKCASFLLTHLCSGKLMQRVWAGGRAEISGCLDDYAFMVRALLDLATVESNPQWLSRAVALNETIVGHFFSHHAGFYFTANNKEQALVRTGCIQDNGSISPAAVELTNLLRLNEITGDPHLKSVIDRTLKIFGDDVKAEPSTYGYLLAAMDRIFNRGERLEIVEVEGKDYALAAKLKQEAWRHYAPHMVQVILAPEQFAAFSRGGGKGGAPRGEPGTASGAYFCNSLTGTCELPVTSLDGLKAKLAELASRGKM